MTARYRLPDGSIYEVTIGTEGQPDIDARLNESPSFADMELDSLSGRDLDAKIARRLFGLKVEPRENTRTRQRDFVYEVHPGQWVQVAYYSSGSAWLEVVSELSKRGWTRIETPVRAGSHWNEPGDPTVVFQHTDGRRVDATGPENTALCRAALKAVDATPQ